MKNTGKLTHAVEDYLKAVYTVAGTSGRATTNDLAEELGVSPASVTGMVQKLAAATPPLLDYQKHRGVALTETGRMAALKTIRHHRLIEMFLHQILGFNWDEVHEEAERLEHVISEDLEERIAQALGNPTHDPHGDPIPTTNLELPPTTRIPLSDVRSGQTVVVERVSDNDPSLLRYLSELGIKPSVQLKVESHSPFDGNLHLRLIDSDQVVVLGPKVTDQVYIEPLEA